MSETEADQSSSIYCKDCGSVISVHESDGERVPCFRCGSTRRNFKETVTVYKKVTGGVNGNNNER